MNWDFVISHEDTDLCATYAVLRHRGKRRYGVENQRVTSKETDFDIDFRGVRGELAFARAFGLQVHQLDGDNLSGDGGVKDYVLHGKTISVKTRQQGGRYCLTPQTQYPPKADFIVCVEELEKTTNKGTDTAPKLESVMRIVGWCTNSEYRDNIEVRDLGHGPTAGVRDRVLHAMDEFEAAVKS
jgi:hypothetical protein